VSNPQNKMRFSLEKMLWGLPGVLRLVMFLQYYKVLRTIRHRPIQRVFQRSPSKALWFVLTIIVFVQIHVPLKILKLLGLASGLKPGYTFY